MDIPTDPRAAARLAIRAAELVLDRAPPEGVAALEMAKKRLAGQASEDDVDAALQAILTLPGLRWFSPTRDTIAGGACADALMAADACLLAESADDPARRRHFSKQACAASRRAVRMAVQVNPGLQSRIESFVPPKPVSRRR